MRTPDPRRLAIALLLLTATPATAFDPSDLGTDHAPDVAMRYGYEAWKAGDATTAAGAFAFAAKRNNVPAQWKLARMYQTGDGVERDERVAFDNYMAIAKRYRSLTAPTHLRAYVVHAHRALGSYLRHGLDDGRLAKNAALAERHLYRAAALYGDRNAQYELADFYHQADDDARSRLAARWFQLAGARGHVMAQVRLGEMFASGDGVRHDPVRGMLLLIGARDQLGDAVREDVDERLRLLTRMASGDQLDTLSQELHRIGQSWSPNDHVAVATGD